MNKLKKIICLAGTMGMVLSLSVPIYAQEKNSSLNLRSVDDVQIFADLSNTAREVSVEKLSNSSKIVQEYLIEDNNENIQSHKVVIMDDGTAYEFISELVSNVKENDSKLRVNSSGHATSVYRHKVYGRSANNNYYGYAEFDFEIKYEWDSTERTSEMTYAYCTNVVQGFSRMYDIGRSGSKAWAHYIGITGCCNSKYTYTVDIYGDVTESFRTW